jgi:transposase
MSHGDDSRKRAVRRSTAVEGIPAIRTRVAGIDLGSEQHFVCAPAIEGHGREVVCFGATTPELQAMCAWLRARKVESVAMESTGVYWIAPHEVLEAAGFQVLLADAKHMAGVAARDKKSDPTDCEWIQRLHSVGMLKGAFRPSEQICILRTLTRDKATLVAEASDWIRRMQKSLDQMNVRVHRAVSNLNGVTGLAILRAIVNGERNPVQLAKLRDPHCKKSEAEIAEQLTGHWRADHLFSLSRALEMYDQIQRQMEAYDREILRQLEAMRRPDNEGPAPPLDHDAKQRKIQRHGQELLRQALYGISGTDLARIDAIGVDTALTLLSEHGVDLSSFPNEKKFIQYLRLAPNKPTSGGKPVKKKKRTMTSTRVAGVLRMAAQSMRNSSTALGAYYRSVARRKGGDVAIFATARKLAQFVYRTLRHGQPYVDIGAEAWEHQYHHRRLAHLQASAKGFGYELVPTAACT